MHSNGGSATTLAPPAGMKAILELEASVYITNE